MAFPLAALITVLPELLKQLPTKPRTMMKEGAAGGIGLGIYWVVQDMSNCTTDGFASISCVTPDHWQLLAVSALALVAQLNSKRKEAVSDSTAD